MHIATQATVLAVGAVGFLTAVYQRGDSDPARFLYGIAGIGLMLISFM